MLLRIEGVPPRGVALQPFLEPGHLGGEPLFTFVVVEDVVVLACHLDQRDLAAQEFQGGEHLEALDERHVGVGIAVEQQQWRVNLVGTEQRRLVDIELTVRPRVAVGH